MAASARGHREGQDALLGAVMGLGPRERARAQVQFGADLQQVPVQLEVRALDADLPVRGQPPERLRLGQPGRGGVGGRGGAVGVDREAQMRLVRGPRHRDAAAVAAGLGAVRAEEVGVLAVLGRERGVLGQPELVALVDVRRAGQGQLDHRRRPCPTPAQRLVGLLVLGRDAGRVGAGVREAVAGGVPDRVVVGEHPGVRGADLLGLPEGAGDGRGEGLGVPAGHEVGEVEGLVHLVRADVAEHARQRGDPGLSHHHRLVRVGVQHAAPLAVDLVDPVLVDERHGRLERVHVEVRVLVLVGVRDHAHAGVVRVRVARLLDEPVGHVHTEPVHAAVQPEPQDVLELRADLRVLPVQVRLGGVEQVEVPLARRAVRLGHAGPRAAAEGGLPVVRGQLPVLAAALREVVAGPLGGARTGGQGGLEPGVVGRGVVGDEVHDHADPGVVRGGDHLVRVLQRAEPGVHGAVVRDVVAGVVLRGQVEGGEPDRVHPEPGEVRDPRGDAGQVAHAVAVPVRERAGIHLVDHRVGPPRGGGAVAGLRGRRAQGGDGGALRGHGTQRRRGGGRGAGSALRGVGDVMGWTVLPADLGPEGRMEP